MIKKLVFFFSILFLIPLVLLLFLRLRLPQSITFSPPTSTPVQAKPTSLADLSSILITAPNNATITVFDSLGNTVGETFIQNPLKAAGKTDTTSKTTITEYMLSKPTNGTYSAHITTTGSVTIYLYDLTGTVTQQNFIQTNTATYKIFYTKIAQSTIIKQ